MLDIGNDWVEPLHSNGDGENLAKNVLQCCDDDVLLFTTLSPSFALGFDGLDTAYLILWAA